MDQGSVCGGFGCVGIAVDEVLQLIGGPHDDAEGCAEMFFERFGDVGGYFFRFGAGFKDCVAALEVGFYALVAERDEQGAEIGHGKLACSADIDCAQECDAGGHEVPPNANSVSVKRSRARCDAYGWRECFPRSQNRDLGAPSVVAGRARTRKGYG